MFVITEGVHISAGAAMMKLSLQQILSFKPCCAEIIVENINLYLHFVLFLITEMATYD